MVRKQWKQCKQVLNCSVAVWMSFSVKAVKFLSCGMRNANYFCATAHMWPYLYKKKSDIKFARVCVCACVCVCMCVCPLQWMRARWTSDPCYAFYGVDGSDCSFLVYLSEVEWFCPPLAWRNQSNTPPTQHTPPARTAPRQVSICSPLGRLMLLYKWQHFCFALF